MKYQIDLSLLLVSVILFVGGCKKEATAPTVTTGAVTEITQNTAKAGGTITDNGGSDIKTYGVCWSVNPDPTTKDSLRNLYTDQFIVSINGLVANTKYYIRAFATNGAGTGYGNSVIFTTTAAVLPEVKSTYPTNLTQTSAQCGGEVISDGGAPVTRGICWSTNENPTIANSKTTDGQGEGVYTSNLTGLTNGTIYYVRAYATNSVGTTYGSNVIVRTVNSQLTDVDGNTYKTVIIGTQEWMSENLKTTKYRNGDAIPNVEDAVAWSELTSGAYSNYNNNPSNGDTYGRLYNFYTIVDIRGLCPSGWHVPSDAEWKIMEQYLGLPIEELDGGNNRGLSSKLTGKLLEVGTLHWPLPNSLATNESGFSALPGGIRLVATGSSAYGHQGLMSYFWTSTQYNGVQGYFRKFSSSSNAIFRYNNILMSSGLSVRCVKE